MTKEKAKARVPGLTGSLRSILIFFINQNDAVLKKINGLQSCFLSAHWVNLSG
jgi:hypothetical protein